MYTKEVLEEFIYSLNKIIGFKRHVFTHIAPSTHNVGFSFDNTLPSKFVSSLNRSNLLPQNDKEIICILADYETTYEGIIFTSKSICVNSQKNSDKFFLVSYDEIAELKYNSVFSILVIRTRKEEVVINTHLWNLRSIFDFLQFASGKHHFDEVNKSAIERIRLKTSNDNEVGAVAAGITYSNVSNASSLYFDDKIVSPRGHGFAAEHANHLADIYEGQKAAIVGDNNAKNGPDRIVNGVHIQSKYCASGSKCIQECFESGSFRYWNPDGTPMQIEVPSDMYESAIQAMEHRIQRGEVSGVTDPAEAKNIIRKGHFTYAQAKNIAKAGTIESITYDAASGAIIAKNAFGVTVALTFATEIWRGEPIDKALKASAGQGLKVGGTAFITSILAGQLSKAGLNSLLTGSSEAVVKILGPKASALLANAFRNGANIYGAAAMKSAAKLLRSNAITGLASVIVLSLGDVVNIFRGRISGAQLAKNVANTTVTVAGGGLGWVGGSGAGAKIGGVIGSFIAPGVGTGVGAAVGGFLGGLVGSLGAGAAASKASQAVLDTFIEDDADKMVAIIQEVFTELADEYLITQKEAEHIVNRLQSVLTGKNLKDMFASSSHRRYARDLMEYLFEDVSKKRSHITLPTQAQMVEGLKEVLEDIADEGITMA